MCQKLYYFILVRCLALYKYNPIVKCQTIKTTYYTNYTMDLKLFGFLKLNNINLQLKLNVQMCAKF